MERFCWADLKGHSWGDMEGYCWGDVEGYYWGDVEGYYWGDVCNMSTNRLSNSNIVAQVLRTKKPEARSRPEMGTTLSRR
jgi:hypothetical protein